MRLAGVHKSFGAVHALRGVDLTVPSAAVTALVGDNGAGKSVTVKVVAGTHLPDEGQMFWEGRPVHPRTPREAAALGIEVVYQDLALCDNLDVVQNMFLGREAVRRGFLDEDAMERAAMRTLADLQVTTIQSVRLPVASLSGGQRQSVAVAKAVMWNSKLVILDEPTAALGVAQTRQVLNLVRRLAERASGSSSSPTTSRTSSPWPTGSPSCASAVNRRKPSAAICRRAPVRTGRRSPR